MIECLMSWTCLVIGAFKGDVSWFIASGIFAIASHLDSIIERMKHK